MNVRKATAAGAVDFKSWYVVVWLTPGVVDWPRCCACCGRMPEATVKVTEDDRVVAEYPICRPCRRHAKLDDIAMGISMLVGALVVLGGWIAKFGLSVMYRWGLQLVLMFLAFVLVTGAAYWLINFFFSAKRSNCPDDGWPVETYSPAGFGGVLGKDSERTDEKELRLWCEQAARELGPGAYALQLRSNGYARELIQKNGGDPTRIQIIHEAF